MRITYLHQYFNTREMSGGTRSYEFARRLVEMGHSVDLLTTSRGESSALQDGWVVSNEDGIRVHWTSVPYSNTMSYRDRMRAFGAYAVRASSRASSLPADVVFASSTPLTVAIPGVIAAKRTSSPLVFEVRDLWPEVPIALGALRAPGARSAARALERFAYRHSERVVALSSDMRDGVARSGYPLDRIDVISNAADLDLFNGSVKAGKALRESDTWIGDRPLVAYCGTLGLVNGVEYIVRVAANMLDLDPDVRFIIAGDGRCLAETLYQATALGVLDVNLRVAPPVPKREVVPLLGAATMAMSTVIDVPACHSNSANKFFDALAAGTPIAINHGGWQADLLRSSGAGLVLSASNHAEAAADLLTVLRNSEKRAGMSVAAKRLAVEKFDRDKLARELEDSLLSAIRSFNGRGQKRSN